MKPVRVLIVDDEPDVLFTMKRLLTAEGHEVAVAADGGAAMLVCDEFRPDVIVLDIRMPVLDGWYVLAEVAERDPSPRVIVCTANADTRDHTRALTLGAETVLVKPYDPEELCSLVQVPAGATVPSANI